MAKLNKILPLFICLVLGIFSCAKKENHYVPQGPQLDVTGKGNGGNEMKMTEDEIRAKLNVLKPRLLKVFEGLKALNQSEQLSPGVTELKVSPLLQELIHLMTADTAQYENVFKDIATADNFGIQVPPCVDLKGVKNAAAAVEGEIGGVVCISLSRIQEASIKDAEYAVDVMIMSLIAHEFGHHYLNSGDRDADEKMARDLQDFITSQMNKYQVLEVDGTIISASETIYLDRFVFEAKEILKKATASNVIRVP